MSIKKYIYWRPDMEPNEEGEIFAEVHLLVGYNQGTLEDFQKMAEKLRETFPQATNDKVRGGKVHTSNYMKNFSIVEWSGYIPKADYPGWFQWEDTSLQEHHW